MAADSDHNGKVEYGEFRAYVEKRRMDMERAFDKLDADTEGRHLGGINSQTLVRCCNVPSLQFAARQPTSMCRLMSLPFRLAAPRKVDCRTPSIFVSGHPGTSSSTPADTLISSVD